MAVFGASDAPILVDVVGVYTERTMFANTVPSKNGTLHRCRERPRILGVERHYQSRLVMHKGKKVKERIISYGITQCYLPPDRGDRFAFTPTGQVGTRFIDPVRMKG